ncbi:hypothetical protein BV25DRAFT_1842112 [Artomyces pyxidatus]|uniref:Uncharacterized protein n=1 Tax=Artomyces pyxidatus TaxID=48021 RepID=A0ACB8SLH9_9AGAM|nr:hypothetical protein BV25DRAFT_1842112 [Artomyces pyxidatus]
MTNLEPSDAYLCASATNVNHVVIPIKSHHTRHPHCRQQAVTYKDPTTTLISTEPLFPKTHSTSMLLSYKVDSTTIYTHIVTVKVLTLHRDADIPETTLTPMPLWWTLAHPPLQICPRMSLYCELFGKPDIIKVGVYLGYYVEHAYFHLSGSAFLQVPRQWTCPPQTLLDKLLSSFILCSRDGYNDLHLALTASCWYHWHPYSTSRRAISILRGLVRFPEMVQIQHISVKSTDSSDFAMMMSLLDGEERYGAQDFLSLATLKSDISCTQVYSGLPKDGWELLNPVDECPIAASKAIWDELPPYEEIKLDDKAWGLPISDSESLIEAEGKVSRWSDN